MTTSIKVLEKFEPEIKVFTKDDFLKYLELHKNDLKEISTFKLNKMFSIKGYQITRIKNEIGLKISSYIPKNIAYKNKNNTITENNNNFLNDLKLLDDKIEFIIQVLKEHEMIPNEE
jgi:hypothetical protein